MKNVPKGFILVAQQKLENIFKTKKWAYALKAFCIFMSRKGPVAVKGMLDFVEDLIKDVNLH